MSLINREQLADLKAVFNPDDLMNGISGVRDSVRAQLNWLSTNRQDRSLCEGVLHDVAGVAACYAFASLACYACACSLTLSDDGLTLEQIQHLIDLADLCASEILLDLDTAGSAAPFTVEVA